MKLKDVKKGEYFTKKQIEYPTEVQVFVRGEYDRSMKKYECWKWSDVNSVQYLDGKKEVYIDFTF